MGMEFLIFDNESVAHLAAHDQDDDLFSFDILQGTQVACPELKLGERIGPQTLDRFRWRRRLVLEPGLDCRFQDSLLTHWQRPKLPVSLLGDPGGTIPTPMRSS
jgi:hypothetical protein